MLGDSILSDIRGANRAGFSSGLLLSGISSVNHINPNKKADNPDFIFESL
jgi:ribonucleotide monophosphatase NagD (HAD superfamily)